MGEYRIPENILTKPISTLVFFDLVQDGKLHRYKATPERLKIIINCLKSRNFDEILSDNPISSDSEINPHIVHVSSFGILVYPSSNIKSHDDRAGMFFNYLIDDKTPNCIINQLKRYQIYKTLVDKNGNRIEDLEDCCFVYALKMSNKFSEAILNQIRIRIQNRYLPFRCIEEICNEFKIHLITLFKSKYE